MNIADIRNHGNLAYYMGLDQDQNPYSVNTKEFSAWLEGWQEAEQTEDSCNIAGKGSAAFQSGKKLSDNPCMPCSNDAYVWSHGWATAAVESWQAESE